MSIPAPYARAITRYAPKLDRSAKRRYGISGAALLAKTLKGESGFDMGAVSTAGARGGAQFMPGTRRAYIDRYGIDPWRSPREAVHAMEIFLKGSGLEGYNPGGGQGYVNYILGQHVGNVRKQLGLSGALGGGGSRPARSALPSAGGGATGGLPGVSVDAGGGQGVAALLTALQAESRPSLPSTIPQAPSSGRSRYLHMPAVPQGGGLPDPGPSTADLLAAIGGGVEGGDMPTAAAPSPLTRGPGGKHLPARVGRIRGRSDLLRGNPIDRPGVRTNPKVLSFVQQVATVYGKPITLGTGTKHDQYVLGTHRESDHWTGNAIDLPMTGAALTRMGQAALIAAGMPRSQALKERGGVYNVGGVQILFNTKVGGNHYNHLHVGLHR